MYRTICRISLMLCLLSCISACGGGGSDSASQPASTVSVSPDQITVGASTDQSQSPQAVINVTVSNATQTLYAAVAATEVGVAQAYFYPQTQSTAQVSLTLRPPSYMGPGTYRDTVTISVCYDANCTRYVSGTPKVIPVLYTVTAGGGASVSLQNTYVSATAIAAGSATSSVVPINVNNPRGVALYSRTFSSGSGIERVSVDSLASAQPNIRITYKDSGALAVGSYNGTITVDVCYDAACTQPVPGSPMSLQTSYTVTSVSRLAALEFSSVRALTHDVVDAEYSPALNAIVMVSGTPYYGLYVYDLASASEQFISLARLPAAVSVSADGYSAAVGHDALISVVDLRSVGKPGATAVSLDVSARISDVVLAGNYVYAFPAVDQWVNIHSVAIDTNIDTLSNWSIYAGTRARLHPDGRAIYGANNGLSPSDIERYDISGGPAVYQYDSPYHGDYPMCGDLWFKPNGTLLYTACGTVLKSSGSKSQDMLYGGSLELEKTDTSTYKIVSLSESTVAGRVVALEVDSLCGIFTGPQYCSSVVAYFDSRSFGKSAVYVIPPITSDAVSYVQRGLHVFYGTDGQKRYLLSKLLDGSAAPTYYLGELK